MFTEPHIFLETVGMFLSALGGLPAIHTGVGVIALKYRVLALKPELCKNLSFQVCPEYLAWAEVLRIMVNGWCRL